MPRTSDARQRLLDSARELMYARGYTAVGVQELCDHADVNKGSFYHFFPSKRDLVLQVIDGHGEWFKGVLRDAAAENLPALERIRYLFERLYDFDRSVTASTGGLPGCPVGNLAAELNSQDPVVRAKIQQVFEDWLTSIEATIREAAAQGEIEDVDPREAAEAILAYMEGLQLVAATQKRPDMVRDLAAGALRLAGATPQRARTRPRGERRDGARS